MMERSRLLVHLAREGITPNQPIPGNGVAKLNQRKSLVGKLPNEDLPKRRKHAQEAVLKGDIPLEAPKKVLSPLENVPIPDLYNFKKNKGHHREESNGSTAIMKVSFTHTPKKIASPVENVLLIEADPYAFTDTESVDLNACHDSGEHITSKETAVRQFRDSSYRHIPSKIKTLGDRKKIEIKEITSNNIINIKPHFVVPEQETNSLKYDITTQNFPTSDGNYNIDTLNNSGSFNTSGSSYNQDSFDPDYEASLNNADNTSFSSAEDNTLTEDEEIQLQQNTNSQSSRCLLPVGPTDSQEDKALRSTKVLCPFCFDTVGHFSRHIFKKHDREEEIKKISSLLPNSYEKRAAVIALRKKGNFIASQNGEEVKPVRKPVHLLSQLTVKNSNEEYAPCPSCLGYYKRAYLWRHKKYCKAASGSSSKKHLTDSQTFLACTGSLGNYLSKGRLKKEVFGIMRPDHISRVAKSDPLICLYGESYLNRHKRQQMNTVVSSKMRELARLKIALTKSTTITNFVDILKPNMYNYIVAAAKIISGFDPDARTFQASSLALHLGTNLKFLCDVAKKAIVTRNSILPTLSGKEVDEKVKDISDLREIISSHWCNDVGSLANKVLNEKKWEKPKLLPLTEDINTFNKYVTTQANQAYEKLGKGEDKAEKYKKLTECTLCLVLVFNRKRIGEVQFLDIETYQRDFSTRNQEEFLQTLSEFEKVMSSSFKRVVVFGKGSKPVPILFTKRMQKFVDLLLNIRRNSDIIPKTNKFIFANPGSNDRWISGAAVLRKYAQKCGAKRPNLLTSTRFRKQIATILQLMHFGRDEMAQIAKFLGHTEQTHLEFYRLTEDVYQTAKVAKVLLLLNAGKGAEFKGKSLNDITVVHDVVDFDEEDKQWRDHRVLEQSVLEPKLPTSGDIEKSPTPNCSNKELIEKKQNRVPWTAKSKHIVLDFFQNHVKQKRAPKKSECLTLVQQHPGIFKESDWLRIKTLVYNTYRDL